MLKVFSPQITNLGAYLEKAEGNVQLTEHTLWAQLQSYSRSHCKVSVCWLLLCPRQQQ